MSGSPSPPRSPSDPALDQEPVPALSAFLDRPEPARSWRERVGELLARAPVRPWRLVAMVVAAALVVAVLVWLLRPPAAPIETTLPRATVAASGDAAVAPTTGTSPPSTAPSALVVDAAGAVARPGLYRLSAGARVDDLIRRAGGLAAGADHDRLNLAAPLADGQRLYVPEVGELVPPSPVDPVGGSDPAGSSTPTSGPGGGSGGESSATAPIDLNTATADELDSLPGVGPSTAASILDYRTQHGRFRSVDELLEVRGIGDAKLAALRPKVRV